MENHLGLLGLVGDIAFNISFYFFKVWPSYTVRKAFLLKPGTNVKLAVIKIIFIFNLSELYYLWTFVLCLEIVLLGFKLSRFILDIMFIWLPINTKILVMSLAFFFFFFEPWYFGYLLGPSIDCRTCQWEDPGEGILREGTFHVRSLIYWNIEREDQVVWSLFSECLLILLRHPYLWKLVSLHCQPYSLSFHVLHEQIQIYLQLSFIAQCPCF